MANNVAKVGYSNYGDAATLTGSACTSGRALTEMQTRELARYTEFTSASPEVIIDLGSAKTWQTVCLFAHTVEGVSDTMLVNAGTTSGASDVYAGSALTCWPFTPLDSVRDGSHFGLFFAAVSPITARYIKIILTTSAAPRIGRLFVGPTLAVEYNPEYGNYTNDWQDANSSVDRTENGADWVATRTELRRAAFTYSRLTHAEGSLLHEIVRTHSITGEVVFLAHTTDRAKQQQYSFLGTLSKLSALEYPVYDVRSAAIGIAERGGAP